LYYKLFHINLCTITHLDLYLYDIMTEVCILNDPDLGIISENDHRVGLCLCHKCSCGKHKCVYRKLFSRISLRHKSSYRAFSIPLKFRKIIPVSASKKSSPSRKLKFISQSTYKEDCLPDRDFKTIDNRNIFKPNYKFKTGRSSYNDEYTAKPLETLKPCVPFKPSKVSVGEFQGQSTYKSDFIKGDNRKPFRYKSVPKLKILDWDIG
jgi:hypothetical protein